MRAMRLHRSQSYRQGERQPTRSEGGDHVYRPATPHYEPADSVCARSEPAGRQRRAAGHARLAVLSQQRRERRVLPVESNSIDELREYADAVMGDSSENSYFEVDAEIARGLPQLVGA
jgi:hypothetical protein